MDPTGLADQMENLAEFVERIPERRFQQQGNDGFRDEMFDTCHFIANSLDFNVAHYPEHFEGAREAPPELSDEVAVLTPLLRKIALEFRANTAE